MAMATRGGSAVTWKTVLAICPLALPPDRAVTMYIPYEIVHSALPSTVIAHLPPPAQATGSRLKAQGSWPSPPPGLRPLQTSEGGLSASDLRRSGTTRTETRRLRVS